MFWIIVCLAALTATVGFAAFWQWVFIPKRRSMTGLIKKRMTEIDTVMNVDDRQRNEERRRVLADLCRKSPVFGLPDQKYDELVRLIDTVEWSAERNVKPEDIYFQQIMYSLCYAVAVVILAFFFRPLILGLAVLPFVFKIPVFSLKSIAEEETKEIMFQFPDFYDAVYAQYSTTDTNILLSDVVEPYIPVAGSSFKRMLKRFLIDLQSGDDKGLEMLDQRYCNNATIHKFCAIMRQRLKGDPASIVTMHAFREMLQADVRDFRQNDLEKRKKYANTATIVMVFTIVSIIMIVYFAILIQMGTTT